MVTPTMQSDIKLVASNVKWCALEMWSVFDNRIWHKLDGKLNWSGRKNFIEMNEKKDSGTASESRFDPPSTPTLTYIGRLRSTKLIHHSHILCCTLGWSELRRSSFQELKLVAKVWFSRQNQFQSMLVVTRITFTVIWRSQWSVTTLRLLDKTTVYISSNITDIFAGRCWTWEDRAQFVSMTPSHLWNRLRR